MTGSCQALQSCLPNPHPKSQVFTDTIKSPSKVGAPLDASIEARLTFWNAGGQMGRLSYQEPSPAGFDPLRGLSWTSGPARLLRAGEKKAFKSHLLHPQQTFNSD